MSTHAEIIARAMACGLSCSSCGILMGKPGHGRPRLCGACSWLNAMAEVDAAKGDERDRLLRARQCPVCDGIFVSERGRDQHMRMTHRVEP